jgi:hypothetical protein
MNTVSHGNYSVSHASRKGRHPNETKVFWPMHFLLHPMTYYKMWVFFKKILKYCTAISKYSNFSYPKPDIYVFSKFKIF